MQLEIAEKLIPNVRNWLVGDINDLEILDIKDIEKWMQEFYENTGNYSDWDCIKICATALYYMKGLNN